MITVESQGKVLQMVQVSAWQLWQDFSTAPGLDRGAAAEEAAATTRALFLRDVGRMMNP